MNKRFQLQGEMEKEVLGDLEGFKYSAEIKDKADEVIERANRNFQQRFIDVFDFLLAAKSEGVAEEENIEMRLKKLEELCFEEFEPEVEDLIDQDLDIRLKYRQYENDLWYLPDGSLGYEVSGGKTFTLPTFRELIRELTPEKRQEIMKKKSQGFDGLVVTPFGLSLERSFDELKRIIKTNDALYTTSGKRVQVKNEFIDLWNRVEKENPVYPLNYNNTDGSVSTYMRKSDLLKYDDKNVKFPGWNIGLVENLINLPRRGQGQTIGGRAQLETHERPCDVIKRVQSEEPYRGETFFTLEDWLALAGYNISTHNLILDDIAGEGSGTILIGSYMSNSPSSFLAVEFDHTSNVIKIDGSYPTMAEPEYGFRTMYKIL